MTLRTDIKRLKDAYTSIHKYGERRYLVRAVFGNSRFGIGRDDGGFHSSLREAQRHRRNLAAALYHLINNGKQLHG